MPFVNRGVVTCQKEINTTLISVARTNFGVILRFPQFQNQAVRHYGIVRHVQQLPNLPMSAFTQVASSSVWINSTLFRLTNVNPSGVIRFWVPKRSFAPLDIEVWEDVP